MPNAEVRFRAAFERSPIGKALISIAPPTAGQLIEVNEAFCALFGYGREQLVGQLPPRALEHPQDAAVGMAELARLMSGEIESCNFEKRFIHGDGAVISVALWLSVIDESEQPYLLAHFEDITRRKAAEAALRDSEERYRQIIETTSQGVWIVGADTRTTFASSRMAEMLGYFAEEMIGMPLWDLVVGPTPDVRALLELGRGGVTGQREVELRRRNGSGLWVSISQDSLHSSTGAYVGALAMVSDITDRRRADEAREASRRETERLEAALHQSQKLETVGQLAGGVAHDFNNVLAIILNASDFALAQLEGHPAAEELRSIHDAAERAAALTRQLLVFSRREVVETEVMNLNELVSTIERLLRRVIGEHIELGVDLAEDLPAVMADSSHLELMVLNLVLNARDAMPDGGRLRVTTSAVDLDDWYTNLHPDVAPGPYVRLAVTDTGAGIAPEVLEHVFEPFFTTKTTGAGTGLGLATTYGIVKQNGGHIELYSAPGQGTAAKIYLPASTAVASGRAADGQPEPRAGAGRRILVVEDDDQVRAIAVRILAAHGYSVTSAAHPQEALDAAASTEVDAVLTDVVMPNMSGPQLIEALRERAPGLRAVFMSGYTDRPEAIPADAVFLSKPFSRQTLLDHVAEALEG